MMVALCLTVSACVGFMLFGWFSHMLPQLRLKMGKVQYIHRHEIVWMIVIMCMYLSHVLLQ